MSLLTELQDNALEPEYRNASRRGERPSPLRRGLALGVLAMLLVLAGVNTFRSSSDVAAERSELLARVAEANARLADLEQEQRDLNLEIQQLGDEQVTDPAIRSELAMLGPIVGDVAVTGPGIVVAVDDAPNRSGAEGLVFDSDLSRLVNGLRQAGAEAIAINGRRVTAVTPIRSAGSAITVDYVSLSPPYVVEAIGDPAELQPRFARTSASVWWKYISDNFGIGFSIREADADLVLPADPGMNLRFGQKMEGD